jgi:hypothetical protein
MVEPLNASLSTPLIFKLDLLDYLVQVRLTEFYRVYVNDVDVFCHDSIIFWIGLFVN